MRRLRRGFLMIGLAAAYGCACAAALPNYSDWMAAMTADTPLNQMMLPGTHDSASYAISSSSKFTLCADDTLPSWLEKISDALPVSIVRTITAGWSKTQTLSLYDQLEQGARYLDLRVCNSSSATGHKALYGCHNLLGAPLQDLLGQVARFAKQHPLEVVLLDINHQYSIDTAKEQDQLDAALRTNLGAYAVTNALTPRSTLADIRATGRSVIVLYDPHYSSADPLNHDFIAHYVWPQARIQSQWPNTVKLEQLHADFLAHVQQHAQENSAGFDVNQTILTPNSDTVKAGLWPFGSQPHKLEDMAKSVDAELPAWLNEAYEQTPVKPFNIVMVDWYSAQLPLVRWAQRLR